MKKCVKCGFLSLRKFGKRNGKQRYQCKNCNSIIGGKVSPKLDLEELFELYCFKNRTYNQLGQQFGVTIRTIQKWLDDAVYKKRNPKVQISNNYGYNISVKNVWIYGI